MGAPFPALVYVSCVVVILSWLLKYVKLTWFEPEKLEKLKLMMPTFSTSCVELINRWKKLVDLSGEEHCELDVWQELQNLTGDVISRTTFGSSYEEERRIFQLQHELAELIMEIIQFLPIPGYRFLPTKRNIEIRKIDKEIWRILGDLVSKRIKAMKMGDAYNDDLLGILIESNFKLDQKQKDSKILTMTVDEVIEECKLFYLAGQETTTNLLTWTVILLSIHPDWQSRARQEVFEVFGDNKPDYDGLHHLKIVLILYPPAVFIVRRTYKEMKLGKVTFPPDVPMLSIHHDPKYWGDDANEFKPKRFSEGIAKASRNHIAFYPFGGGPRICIGQSFALIEAKLSLAMISHNLF